MVATSWSNTDSTLRRRGPTLLAVVGGQTRWMSSECSFHAHSPKSPRPCAGSCSLPPTVASIPAMASFIKPWSSFAPPAPLNPPRPQTPDPTSFPSFLLLS